MNAVRISLSVSATSILMISARGAYIVRLIRLRDGGLSMEAAVQVFAALSIGSSSDDNKRSGNKSGFDNRHCNLP